MGAVYRESRRTLRKCTLICRANQSTILLAETAGTVSDAVGYSGSRVRVEALPSAGSPSGLHRSPPSYLAPNRLLQWTSVEKATTDLPYELGGTKIGSWGSLRPVGAPKEKPPYDQSSPKNRERRNTLASSELFCALRRRSRRASGLCGMQFPLLTAVKLQACQLLFCNFFLFGKEKSWPFPFVKGKYFIKNSVCLQSKKYSFCYKIFDCKKSKPSRLALFSGTRNGNRTHIIRLRIWCPDP